MNLSKSLRIIELPKILDNRGNLTFIEENSHIPFSIKRVYWIYDVPGGEIRGGHAFTRNQEFIIALSGSFDVVLDDGIEQKKFHLNRSYFGLYVPEMIWRSIENFSTNSVAFICSSIIYQSEDYIYDYETFKTMKKNG